MPCPSRATDRTVADVESTRRWRVSVIGPNCKAAYTVSNGTEDLNGRCARFCCPLGAHGFHGSPYGLMFGPIGFSERVAAPEHRLFQSVPRQVRRSNC
jgi:hypothetical protein